MGCEFCNKEGLPVFPVRTAIVEKGSSFLPLPPEFKSAYEAKGDMSYSTRILRSGFLYVYNEKDNIWKDYFVTPEGYYACLPPGMPLSPALMQGKKPCAGKLDEIAKASFITLPVDIKNPDNNGVFYLSWSAHPWTEAVRNAHKEAKHRIEHMQLFDAKKWINESKHEQAMSISALQENIVAEYHKDYTNNVANPFKFSSLPWHPYEHDSAKNVCKFADILMPGHGVILNLDDPVALAHDLAFLVPHLLDKKYYSNPLYMRELTLSTSISQIKAALLDQFELSQIQASIDLENQYRYGGFSSIAGVGITMPMPEQADKIHNITQEKFKQWAEDEWNEKYAIKYDDKLKEAFDNKFKSALTEYDKNYIYPMAQLFVEILESPEMKSYHDHNFDENNLDSGIAFTDSITMCLATTQDKGICFEKYVSWLKGSTRDDSNLLLRALLLNQKTLREKLKETTNGSPLNASELGTLSWSTLATEFGNYLGSRQTQVDQSSSTLVSTITGPITEIVKESAKNNVISESTVALAVIQKKRIGIFQISGIRESFVTQLTTRVMNGMGLKGKEARASINPVIRARIRQLEGLGLKFNTTNIETNFIAIYDYDELEKLANKSLAQKIQNGAKAIFTPKEALDFMSREGNENILELWENRPKGQNYIEIDGTVRKTERATSSKTNNSAQTTPPMPEQLPEQTTGINNSSLDNSAKYKTPYISSILGSVLQAGTILIMLTEVGNGLENKKVEGWHRFAANIFYFLGSLMGVVEKRLLYMGKEAARIIIKGVVKSLSVRFFTLTSRVLGGIGGIIMCSFDFVNGWEQIQRNNIGMATLYFASGVLTFFLIFSFLYIPIIGVVLVAALIIVSVLIGFNADNDIQKWLECTLWGVNTVDDCKVDSKGNETCEKKVIVEKYTSVEQEMNELKAALEG